MPGDDGCLDKAGLSSFPMDFTLGVRILPPVKGLAMLLAADIGITGKDDFVRELAPNTPYMIRFAASYAYDTNPPDPEPVVRTVEKKVEVEQAPVEGRIDGRVVEKGTDKPVEGAVVRFEGRDVSPIVSGADGSFRSYAFGPGEVKMKLTRESYEDGTCSAEIPDERPEEGELSVEARCEMVHAPRVGDVDGEVVGEEGNNPIANVTLQLEGPESRNVGTDAKGSFRLSDLEPGTYTVRAEKDGYLIKVDQFDVTEGETVEPIIQMIPKPERPLVRLQRRQIQIRRQVNFATDSARIEPDSSALLNQIADVMLRNPQLKKIEIQGHTDNRGSAKHNMDLSQSRAESVRDWLVEHGVDASMLEAKGYGETRPLVPNITPANRARNRRVQFIIRERDDSAEQ